MPAVRDLLLRAMASHGA